MECLFTKYTNKLTIKDDAKLPELFSQFYENDRHIKQWLAIILKQPQLKDNSESNNLRIEGNKYYVNKDFQASFICYTKALCRAKGNEKGLIYSNRSALFFMNKRYQDCLNDIENSWKYNLPDSIKLKLLIRRAKCFAKLDSESDLKKAVNEALIALSTYVQPLDKDTTKNEIISLSCNNSSKKLSIVNTISEIPTLEPNSCFIFASSAIRLSYDELRGRHVVANKELRNGDILFVEKAYSFAPVFNKDTELSMVHCYNCLKKVYSSIPCKYCTKCIFCNKICRNNSWDEYHKWECTGMQSNLWYHLGIGFPALRALIKGLSCGLQTLNNTYEDDILQFGDEINNYPYFDKLLSNLSKMENITPLMISAGVIVAYLEYYTDFFSIISKQRWFLKYDQKALINFVGARLIKHIAQLQCNSSVINSNSEKNDCLYNLEEMSIACAIYPSISMMNHSCKPNITIEHIGDFAIVRAAEQIQANEEVFNCYGIDYRFTDKKTRQQLCNQFYFFNCNCRICKLEHT